jgi:hypothetical protein
MAEYNDKLDPDAQITMEEGIAAVLYGRINDSGHSGITEDLANEIGKLVVRLVLENFRPDFFD